MLKRPFFIGRNPDQAIFEGTLNVISADRLFGISAVPKDRLVNLSGKCALLNLKPGKIYAGKSRDLEKNRMIE